MLANLTHYSPWPLLAWLGSHQSTCAYRIALGVDICFPICTFPIRHAGSLQAPTHNVYGSFSGCQLPWQFVVHVPVAKPSEDTLECWNHPVSCLLSTEISQFAAQWLFYHCSVKGLVTPRQPGWPHANAICFNTGGCKHSLLQFSSFGTCNKFPAIVSDIIKPAYPNIIQRLLLWHLLHHTLFTWSSSSASFHRVRYQAYNAITQRQLHFACCSSPWQKVISLSFVLLDPMTSCHWWHLCIAPQVLICNLYHMTKGYWCQLLPSLPNWHPHQLNAQCAIYAIFASVAPPPHFF